MESSPCTTLSDERASSDTRPLGHEALSWPARHNVDHQSSLRDDMRNHASVDDEINFVDQNGYAQGNSHLFNEYGHGEGVDDHQPWWGPFHPSQPSFQGRQVALHSLGLQHALSQVEASHQRNLSPNQCFDQVGITRGLDRSPGHSGEYPLLPIAWPQSFSENHIVAFDETHDSYPPGMIEYRDAQATTSSTVGAELMSEQQQSMVAGRCPDMQQAGTVDSDGIDDVPEFDAADLAMFGVESGAPEQTEHSTLADSEPWSLNQLHRYYGGRPPESSRVSDSNDSRSTCDRTQSSQGLPTASLSSMGLDRDCMGDSMLTERTLHPGYSVDQEAQHCTYDRVPSIDPRLGPFLYQLRSPTPQLDSVALGALEQEKSM
jgi:hypothetical protein